MSSSGSPFDPFRRSERTIVRPDPGGRQAAALAAPPSYAREPPVATPAPPASSGEEWVAPQEPVSPFEPPRERQRAIILRREELITPNVNPLMRAASPR
jgi:type VI secretion system protein ImpK